jgi:adenine-specific DNA-methyltransferase
MQNRAEQFYFDIDQISREGRKALTPDKQGQMGQYFTPITIARYMASLFELNRPEVRILDAGAGTGVLGAALVGNLAHRDSPPQTITVKSYEADPSLIPFLNRTHECCQRYCLEREIRYRGVVHASDFIQVSADQIQCVLFPNGKEPFHGAILNPPYKKIRSNSETRRILSSLGIETTNLYSAFLWLTTKLLAEGGELVSITPRSFCNGPYYQKFREELVQRMGIRHIHLFDSRDQAFQEDRVLQENMILHGIKELRRSPIIGLSVSRGIDLNPMKRQVDYASVIRPGDRNYFVHIPTQESDSEISDKIERLPATLDQLGITVSTGRVVDFRAGEYLRMDPEDGTYPLIYPMHCSDGFVEWPKKNGKKPNALVFAPATASLFLPSGFYVLTRRFSAKEERRRIVATLFDPETISAKWVGFENHLNYFHRDGKGLTATLATGLALYLNSSMVDSYFRQFNGHTQVNATDLRRLRYPSLAVLERIATHKSDGLPSQDEIDSIIESEVFNHVRL